MNRTGRQVYVLVVAHMKHLLEQLNFKLPENKRMINGMILT